MNDIKLPKTSCEHCVFRLNGDNGVQNGCELSLLDKYSQRTEVMIEENDTFYTIQNRMCIGCRNSKWAKDKTNPIIDVRKEWAITYSLFVWFGDNHELEDLDITIQSINNLKNKPEIVIFLIKNDDVRMSELAVKIRNLSSKWIFSMCPSAENVEHAIDMNDQNIEGLYYAIYSAGFSVKEIAPKLYQQVREDLRQVVMVKPDEDNNGLIVMTKIHQVLGGNRGGYLTHKIEDSNQSCSILEASAL